MTRFSNKSLSRPHINLRSRWNRVHWLVLLSLVGCRSELVDYCARACIDENLAQTAESCEGDAVFIDTNCAPQSIREATEGEEVLLQGFDCDNPDNDFRVLTKVVSVSNGEFTLDTGSVCGLLGAGAYATSDGYLVGIVQGQREGRLWASGVE